MLPVIFIHSGSQEYLWCAIESTKKYNKDIYLIGDENNSSMCDKWVDANELVSDGFKEFQKCYHHMSSNPEWFEVLCFKRYFLLEQLLEKENIERCIMLDSDVLTYTDFSKLSFIEEYENAFSVPCSQEKFDWAASPHFFYTTKNRLNEFVKFIIATYENNLPMLQKKYDYHLKNHLKGGICDMTLLYLWSKTISFYNTYESENMIFDHTMQEKQSVVWDYVLQMKKIYKNSGQIFFCDANTKNTENVAIVHFQGSTKSVMADFFYNRNPITKVFHRYIDIANRVITKLREKSKR